MYVSENLDIHNFCSILYKFIEANQDKKGGTVETCKYIPYKNNDNVGQLKMLCSSSRVNHLHCEDDCTANDYSVSFSNAVQLRSWAFALIAVSNTAEYRIQIF